MNLGNRAPAISVVARLGLLVLVLHSWAAFGQPLQDRNYVVQRGDTLSGIAHTHGVSLSQLVEQNGLNPKNPIKPGQQLVIPRTSTAQLKTGTAPRRGELPGSIQEAISDAKVTANRWKNIVIHHSGVNTGTLAGMDRYHREVRHMENGLAYHFVIGNDHGLGDGQIGVGSRWSKQLDGGHLMSEAQNKVSIGICLVGNFDEVKPTGRQMTQLTVLIRALMARCKLTVDSVRTHQQINVVHTRCPGRNFPLAQLLSSLKGS